MIILMISLKMRQFQKLSTFWHKKGLLVFWELIENEKKSLKNQSVSE